MTIDLAKCFEEQDSNKIKAFEEYFAGKINGARLAILVGEDVVTTQRLIAGLVSAAVQNKFGCSVEVIYDPNANYPIPSDPSAEPNYPIPRKAKPSYLPIGEGGR